MNRRPLTTLGVVLAALFQLLLFLPAAAQAGATRYTSATYGYSLGYDASWTVVDDTSNDGVDMLKIVNGVSAVTFLGFPGYEGNASLCTEDIAAWLATDDDEPLSDLTLVTSGGDERSAYGVYDYTDTTNGVIEPSRAYLGCQTLVSGEAVLAFLHFAPVSAYEAEFAATDLLLQSLSVVPTSEAGGGTTAATGGGAGAAPAAVAPNSSLQAVFAETVPSLNAFWAAKFDAYDLGAAYVSPASIVAFGETIETGCGAVAPGEAGPFYCPADQTIYLDTEVLDQIGSDFGAAPVAAVIAHEWAHHVQVLLGLIDPNGSNSVAMTLTGSTSLELELMADCMAGAWVAEATARGQLTASDLDAIVQVKSVVGDSATTHYDLQHGSGALRAWWLLRGVNEGLGACLGAA